MTEQQWYAGVDWASESHHVFLTDGAGRKIGEKVFKHSGEGLAEIAAWLLTAGAASSSQINVAIETPHGPVVETLIERGFIIHTCGASASLRVYSRRRPRARIRVGSRTSMLQKWLRAMPEKDRRPLRKS